MNNMRSNAKNNNITPIRIHLELKDDCLSDYQKRMLRRYGESQTGHSITRDILIPSDMPLHNLHYAIQKLFGWQNSHLRKFILPDDIYYKLTGGTVKGWSDLVGVLFQPPSEAEKDIFWDDDYQKGRITTWLKKKYTGPYIYKGYMEHLEVARRDIIELLNQYKELEVRESFRAYQERVKQDKDEKIKILRKASLIEMTLDEMNSSIIIEGGTESLLERLEVNKVLVAQDEELDSKTIFPVTKELIYNYDFGDNWIVTITKPVHCDDLLEQNIIDFNEIAEAADIVCDTHRPVCIHKEGLSVLDDVGGLGGFADLLGAIFESDEKENSANALSWAKSLGWSSKKVANKMML